MLDLVFEQYPKYKQLYEIVWKFRNCLKEQDFDGFEKWIYYVNETMNDSPLLTFVESLIEDLPAVTYAITHKHNNGLAEGSINKIKAIKRQMYGRCSFNLSRKKVLALENRKIP